MRAVEDEKKGEQTAQRAGRQPVRSDDTKAHGQQRSEDQRKCCGHIDIADGPLITLNPPALPAVSERTGQAHWQTDCS